MARLIAWFDQGNDVRAYDVTCATIEQALDRIEPDLTPDTRLC